VFFDRNRTGWNVPSVCPDAMPGPIRSASPGWNVPSVRPDSVRGSTCSDFSGWNVPSACPESVRGSTRSDFSGWNVPSACPDSVRGSTLERLLKMERSIFGAPIETDMWGRHHTPTRGRCNVTPRTGDSDRLRGPPDGTFHLRWPRAIKNLQRVEEARRASARSVNAVMTSATGRSRGPSLNTNKAVPGWNVPSLGPRSKARCGVGTTHRAVARVTLHGESAIQIEPGLFPSDRFRSGPICFASRFQTPFRR